jgi:divalent metal cation (Fe/Co/Zn/Cd) transporter
LVLTFTLSIVVMLSGHARPVNAGPGTIERMTDRPADLRRALRLSALSIAWSGVAGSIAVYAAIATGGLSLLGFGADAVIDSVASIVLVWRFLDETRQPHRAVRVERAAERVVGLALIALATYLAVNAVRALAAQVHPEAAVVALALLVASVAVLPPLALAKYRVAVRLASGALRADSILTAVAALLAVISLISLGASQAFGFWWADAAAALAVATIVLREGWRSLGPASLLGILGRP